MVYRALGALSSSSGVHVACAEFHENAGIWTYDLVATDSYAAGTNALINGFIKKHNLDYRVALITVHNDDENNEFNGAEIAAETGLPVITDLAAIDIALGGNGWFYKSCFEKLGIIEESTLNKSISIAFMGILRWREEYNFLSSITQAKRSSIGGAIWLGQEA